MEDIIPNIIKYLPMKSIMICTTVNKFFNNICSSNHLWEIFLFDTYGNTKIIKNNCYETYKLYFGLNKLIKILGCDVSAEKLYERNSLFLGSTFYQDLLRNKKVTPSFNYKTIPKELKLLDNLQNLCITNLFLPIIPELCKLKNLKKLDMSSNNLTCVPTEMGNLYNLNSLNLSYNKLTSLPSELGNLYKLKTLNIVYNNITTIPLTFRKLHNLNMIYVSNNPNIKIPKELNHLPVRR